VPEIIRFDSAELVFEAFADGFLAVAVAAKVGSSVACAEDPYANDKVGVEGYPIGGQVGPGGG